MNEEHVSETKPQPISKNDECIELKNIKYQTMLINNSINNPKTKNNNFSNNESLDSFLDKEKEHNQKQPWCKLGDGTKVKKIYEFVDEYSSKNKLTDDKEKTLRKYLKKCLDRKKLQRVKDVQYDIESQKITNIPGLIFHKEKNKFTLKNQDKKGSTLKSLAPKRRKNRGKKPKKQNNSE